MNKKMIVVVAIAVILAFGAGFWGWKNYQDVAQQEAQNQEQGVVDTSMSDTFTQSDLNRIFELSKKKDGTKIYYSEKLGVGFTYISQNSNFPINITESGDKINVLDQTIEVFTKDSRFSLGEAVKSRFLQGYNSADCFVKTYETNEQRPLNYISVAISFPLPNNSDVFWAQNSAKCPHDYSETNGVRYFLMNKDVPKKFLFVSVGQSSVASDGTPEISDYGFNWDYSIRILK